jgi:hypothetical protein
LENQKPQEALDENLAPNKKLKGFNRKKRDFEDRFGETARYKGLEIIADSEPAVVTKGLETKKEFEQQQIWSRLSLGI